MNRNTPRQQPRRPQNQTQRGREVPQRRSRRWLWLPVGVLAVIALGAIAVAIGNNGSAVPLEGVTTFSNLAAGHQDGPLTYEQTPPVGGIHNSAWQNCGTYTNPVANENAVHSLEHGAIWITYRPDLSAEVIAQLQQLTRGRTYTLLSPYPNLPSPIVASAWGVQMLVDTADDPRLPRFISTYVQGPQTLEPGAPCTGGISSSIRSQ